MRAAVAEARGENWREIEEQIEPFLELAVKNGYKDLVEEVEGKVIPANDLSLEEEAVMEEHNDLEFWEQLTTRLGQRDLYEQLSPVQRRKLMRQRWLPEVAEKYYEKYEREFWEYGLDRLRILRAKKGS